MAAGGAGTRSERGFPAEAEAAAVGVPEMEIGSLGQYPDGVGDSVGARMCEDRGRVGIRARDSSRCVDGTHLARLIGSTISVRTFPVVVSAWLD